MRLTVLQQQTTALQEERQETGADLSKQLESVKHLLWHGNTEEALERLGDLLMELSFAQARSNAAKKVRRRLDDFRTYICNNREFVPNFGERRRQGETISTAFVDSTINQVVSRRFVKKQQMQWTRGAHLLLQTKNRVLNEDLDDLFRRWYPKFRAQPQTAGARAEGGLTPDFLALSNDSVRCRFRAAIGGVHSLIEDPVLAKLRMAHSKAPSSASFSQQHGEPPTRKSKSHPSGACRTERW